MEGFAFADEATTDVEVPMVVSFEVNPPSGAGVTVFGAAADPSQIPAELTLFIAD
jgi:hypothetical protein